MVCVCSVLGQNNKLSCRVYRHWNGSCSDGVCVHVLLLLSSLVFSSTNNLAKIKLFDLSEY
jgi:hypothetical protein